MPLSDFRTGRIVDIIGTGANAPKAEVLDFSRAGGDFYVNQYNALPKRTVRVYSPTGVYSDNWVRDVVDIEDATFYVRSWDKLAFDVRKAMTPPNTSVPMELARTTENLPATMSYRGCASCSTAPVSTVDTPSGGGGRPSEAGGNAGPLTTIGPVSIPQTGAIKVCLPCMVFWLMVAYLAVSKRKGG